MTIYTQRGRYPSSNSVHQTCTGCSRHARSVCPHIQPLSYHLTFGSGTSHLPAFSLRFCLMVLLSTLALSTCEHHACQPPGQHMNGAKCGTLCKVGLFSKGICALA